MKNIIRALALLLAALIVLSAAFVALAEGSVTTSGSVHLRKGPGLDYRSICTVSSGVKLSYDRTDKDDRGVTWYRVSYDGRQGWISGMYAKEGASGGGEKVTTTSNVHLRSGPGTDYASRTVVDAGTTLTCDRTSLDEDNVAWYHVSYRGKTGWICARYAKRGSDPVGGQITTTGDVHLRTGAGLDYASRRTISAGTTLTYDQTSRDDRGVLWYHVSYKGKKGWVSSMYAKAGGSGGSQDDGKVRLTGSANIRSGPGLDYVSLGTAESGTRLTYRGKTQKDERGVAWYAVTFEGEKGWVSSKYARLK